ncbi:MAG: AI-2E family transporter [Clostridia bacterium]|nr:AI-2E family transporter [Clostridia bacterium]
MDKSLLKNILLTIFFANFLVAIIINLDKISGAASFLRSIILPIIIGFCIAFLLNRPFSFFLRTFEKIDKHLFKKKRHCKLCKALSIITVYIIFLAVITLIFGLILPQLADSSLALYNNRNTYVNNIVEIINFIEEKTPLDISIFQGLETMVVGLVEKLPGFIASSVPKVFTAAGNIASSLTNVLMGFAMSVYMLASKDMLLKQCHDCLYAFVPRKYADKASDLARLASEIFGKYINGQLTDALIVGIICFIGMSVIGLPYALLISTIIAVTNIIPIFGPFIGAIPSAFILLIGEPIHALWFVIFILVLQQIDGNIICPKIVGNSVGLPSWWVLIAIVIGSGVLGFAGMIIGVPTFCIIYNLVSDTISKRLHKKDSEQL